MAHPVVHFEIRGPDDRELADFYAGLFGWKMRPVPGIGYTLIDTGGTGINGGIGKVPDGTAFVTFWTRSTSSAVRRLHPSPNYPAWPRTPCSRTWTAWSSALC
jgi:hypothetical protein